jgi:toxin ParE1/3/4
MAGALIWGGSQPGRRGPCSVIAAAPASFLGKGDRRAGVQQGARLSGCRGEAQTDKYLAEIGAGITRLQEHPELGKSRDDLRAGYRSPRINQHVVYDMVMPSVIRVIRVLHRRMDPDSNLQ